MANATLNPVFESFSRSIGNLTFYTKNGKTYTRRKSAPTGTATPAQEAVRRAFSQAAEDWKGLPDAVKKVWNVNEKICSGYNRFLGINTSRYMKTELIVFCEGFKTMQTPVCTGAAGSTGTIAVSFTLPLGIATGELTLFYRRVPSAGEAYRAYAQVRADAAASGSVSIEGCVPGGWYEVQALLSDKPIASAEAVSASVPLKVQVGA